MTTRTSGISKSLSAIREAGFQTSAHYNISPTILWLRDLQYLSHTAVMSLTNGYTGADSRVVRWVRSNPNYVYQLTPTELPDQHS